MGLFSKAGAHGLAALIDIRCSRYVRSLINRTGAADPQQTCGWHVIAIASTRSA
jgi:hypothetical protein